MVETENKFNQSLGVQHKSDQPKIDKPKTKHVK